MKNLSMGLKLGLSFGILLILMVYISYISYHDISGTINDTTKVSKEYMPEIDTTVILERELRQARLNVEMYVALMERKYFDDAQKQLDLARNTFKVLQSHSEKYPSLTLLAKFVKDFEPEFNNFINIIAETDKKVQENDNIINNLEKSFSQINNQFINLTTFTVALIDTQINSNPTAITTDFNALTKIYDLQIMVMNMYRIVNHARINYDLEELKKCVTLGNEFQATLAGINNQLSTPKGKEAVGTITNEFKISTDNIQALINTWTSLSSLNQQRLTSIQTCADLTAKISDAVVNTTTDELEQTNNVSENSIAKLLWISILATIFGIGLSISLTLIITAPLKKGLFFAQAVANGNLNEELTVQSKDEIGRLADALRSMVTALKNKIQDADAHSEDARIKGEEALAAMEEAKKAQAAAETAKHDGMFAAASQLESVIDHISSASTQLAAQIEESEQGSERQASRVSETATAMEEMNSTVLEVARNASSAADLSNKTKEKAAQGANVVQEAVKSIQNVQKQSIELRDDMQTLTGHAQAISQIMSVISDIADQTNLLALNAAIEAARAGEAGRGFAVVADEVRKLAEKTMASTTDVGNAIKAIQQSANKNHNQVNITVETIENATKLVIASGTSLFEIVNMMDATADQVRAIATASEQQSSTSEEINRSVAEINSIASETARAMQEAANAVSDLASQAQNLSRLVEDMKHN